MWIFFFRLGLLRAIWRGLARAKVGYLALAIGLLFALVGIHIPLIFFCGLIAVFRGRGELKVKHANWVCFGFFLGLLAVFFDLIAYSIDPSIDLFSKQPKARYVLMISLLLSHLSIYTFVYNVFPKKMKLALNIVFGIVLIGSVINFLTMSGLFFVINMLFGLLIVIVLFVTFAIYNRAKMDSGDWYSYGKGDIERDDENKKAEFSKWERGRVNISGFIAAFLALIAIILIFVELYSIGWYYFSVDITEDDHNFEMGIEYGLSEAKVYQRDDEDYEEEELKYLDEKIGDEFEIVEILLIISLVFVSLFLLAAILAGFRLLPGIVPLIVGMVAVIMILSGPLYMIFNIPDAFAEDFTEDDYEEEDYVEEDSSEEDFDGPHKNFWGSDSQSAQGISVESSWGPDWCWYLSLAIAVLISIGSYSCRRIKRYEGGWDEDDHREGSVEYDEEDEDDDEEMDVLERLRRKQRKEQKRTVEKDLKKLKEDIFPTREVPITGSRTCYKCGILLIPNDAAFCQICGANQDRPAGTPPASLDMHGEALKALKTKNKCASCGEMIDPPLVFCFKCVTELTKESSEDESSALSSGISKGSPLANIISPAVPSPLRPTPITPPSSGRYVSAQHMSNISITPPRYGRAELVRPKPPISVMEDRKTPIATISPIAQEHGRRRSTPVPFSTTSPHNETLPVAPAPATIETPKYISHPQNIPELSTRSASLKKPSLPPSPIHQNEISSPPRGLPTTKLITIDCLKCTKTYMAEVSVVPSMVNCPFCNEEKIIDTL